MRSDLKSIFRDRFGKDPYERQLDVTEAILLGLDSVVIVGTGAGKTMPFMIPLLLDDKKKVIIISLLKILQADQCSIIINFCELILKEFRSVWQGGSEAKVTLNLMDQSTIIT